MPIQKHLLLPRHCDKGFTILLSVLIISALAVTIAVSLITLSADTSHTNFIQEQSYMAKALATACAEEALEKIQESTSFVGTGSLTLQNTTCAYTVTNIGGQNRAITAYATIGSLIQKIAISLDKINPDIHIVSWQDVADF
jgi:hypothetical protein